MTDNASLKRRDLEVLWHPCTQMQDHEWLPMIPVRCGRGVWLEDYDGNRYLDAVSSWWVNLFGHAHPHINARLAEQAGQLEHVIMAGFTHEPAIRLAEKLVEITPPGLDRVFYADNGSAAVEVALKMSFHYWLNHQESHQPQRTRFISLANSYHGETLGALAVGDVALYKETYGPLLLEPIIAPCPDDYLRPRDQSRTQWIADRLSEMDALMQAHGSEVCAVIVEPLVQCAGHMRMYDPAYLTGLRQLCDRHAIHLIADEIAVGFGRTGTLFACEQAGISPDFLCLSKGLTGGYLPLSAVLTGDDIYQAFYDEYQTLKAFLHSHSYTGNALGCTAALATLELIEGENIIERNHQTAALMRQAVEPLEHHPHIGDIRQRGMILAMEMVKDRDTREPYPWEERRGIRVYQHGLQNEMLLRPLGNVVYFMPPYVIQPDEIAQMARVAIEGINIATRE